MKPINFSGTTRTMMVPEHMSPSPEQPLPVRDDGRLRVALWKGSWKDRIMFLLWGRLWLFTAGQSHPPQSMSTHPDPFVRDEPQERTER